MAEKQLLTIKGDGFEFKQQVEGDLDAAIAAFQAAFEGCEVTGYGFGDTECGDEG